MVRTAPAAPPRGGRSRFGWWAWTGVLGLVLVAVPVGALVVTNRDPSPVFQGFWWTPIASVPTSSLQAGSIGLDLVIATVLVGSALRLVPATRRFPPAGAVVLTAVVAVAVGAGWTVAAAAHGDAAAALMRATTLRHGAAAPPASTQAHRAVVLGLAQPLAQADHVEIRNLGAVPAGPLVVQTTDVLDERANDEGADVTFESLIDPLDGHVIATWFYGL